MGWHTDPPSKVQIRYLKDLALRCGESFAWPATKMVASEEISRMEKKVKK